jgi:flagellar basal-body rod modification protein FlgD
MMLTELQNQDPLQPTDTSSLLTQISQVGQLQSTSSLQSSISSLALQNSIGAASSLIGKTVTGLDSTNKVPLSGIVNSIQVSGGTVNLQLDNGGVMPLPNVSTITPTATTGTATASSGTTGGATTSSSAATSGA